ncbi:MAG: M20 family metallopeptidase [Gammaproteobacteria bacterium]|jgi:glutamate carboxypeptidase
MSAASAVRDFLDRETGAMAALVEAFARIETPSDVPESQQPMLELLAESFDEIGYRTTRLPARRRFGGHLYARPTRSKPASARQWQLLLGHCDTVWKLGTLERMPVVRDGDVLKGPGVYDMKAGLVEILFALRALRELGLEPSVEPVVFINSDEEVGSRESTRYIRALARGADRALVMEPSLGLGGKLKTARKGVGRFVVKVKGKAAHSGLDPTAGASAILELSHVIQKLFALNDPERGASVNVGVIDGGVRANVVAPESSAIVDVRVATHEDAERIQAAILALEAETPGVALEVQGSVGRPPLEHTTENRQLWRIAVDLAEELDFALEEAMAGGASDGNTTSLYTATLDGLGAVGDGAHADHEQIFVSLLPQRCALLATLLLEPPLKTRSANR